MNEDEITNQDEASEQEPLQEEALVETDAVEPEAGVEAAEATSEESVAEEEAVEVGSTEEAPAEDSQVVDEPTTSMLSLEPTGGSTKWPGQWYVLHTYSGYEDAVADALKQRIESLDMQDKIFDVLVPKENQIEIKAGKRKIVEKKMFPGYVLVNMNVTHDSWFVVRNTPNVTGFIGTDTDPVAVDELEIRSILKRMAIEEPKYNIDLAVSDLVHIKDGPFKGYDGSVSEVDAERGKIKVLVSIFGRETPVELDFLQVQKV